jgi:SAM-dependent methyltransferase
MNANAAIAIEHRTASARCPQCDQVPATLFRTRKEIAGELAMRDAFFAQRQAEKHPPATWRDLTRMLFAEPADILRCEACGILVREAAPEDEAFREDPYELAVLETLHRIHAIAFHEKEPDYRGLLRSGARVVEVGSYVGGFLYTAADWGWDAFGVDIGVDTSRFARSLGFDVRSRRLEDCGFEREAFDAVFIWNCFEQLSSPREALEESRRILRSAGVLVLRVPYAEFYTGTRSVAALASNGLLGWPHRFGFDLGALSRLTEEHGFVFQRVLRAPAILPLGEELRTPAPGWIELTFRKR